MTPQTLSPAALDALDAMLGDCNPPECTDAAMYDLDEEETRTARALFAIVKAAPALLAMARRLGELQYRWGEFSASNLANLHSLVAQLTAATARAEAAEAELTPAGIERMRRQADTESRLRVADARAQAAEKRCGELEGEIRSYLRAYDEPFPRPLLDARAQLRAALAAAKLGGGAK